MFAVPQISSPPNAGRRPHPENYEAERTPSGNTDGLKAFFNITCQFCKIPAIRCYNEHDDQSKLWLMKDFSRGNERSFGKADAEMLFLASFAIGSTQA
jgi:hypothetical protein